MSGETIVVVAATIVVVAVYSIFQGIFNSAKKSLSKTNHIQETQVMDRLDIRNKQSILDGIDHCTDIGEHQEALKLCDIYTEHNGFDEDIEKRKNYIKNLR